MTSPRPSARRLERACGAVVVVLAASALMGSAIDSDRLVRWIGGLPRASPGATGVMLAVGLAHVVRPSTRGLSIAFAGVGLVLAVASTIEPIGDPHPSATALIGAGAAAASVLVVGLGAPVAAQAMAMVSAVVGGVAILAFVYGDRATTIAESSLSNTAISAPSAYAMLIAVVAVFAATPTTGVSAWLTVDSPGRRTVRRLGPAVVGLPLLLAGIGRWIGLERSVGAPRAWAIVMSALVLGIFVIAAVGVPLIDRLSSRAGDAELAELRLSTALRDARVADLAQQLAGALTAADVAEAVNDGVVKVLSARAASYGVVDRSRGLLVLHHGSTVDPAVVERYGTVELERPLAMTDAARDGHPVYAPDAQAYRERYPSSDVTTDELGEGARAAVPLRDRAGATFGSMVIAWDHPVAFDDVVVPTLTTVAELVAQSVERARLADDLARDARRQTGLAELAEALARASTLREVLSSLAGRIAGPVEAVDGVVGLIERGGLVMRRYFRPGTSEGVLAIGERADMTSDSPLVTAARTGAAVLVPSREYVAAQHPEQLAQFDATGFGATANLPLRNRDGELVGALGIAWDHPVDFDASTRLLLSTIAELAAQTIQRAWLSDERGRDSGRAAQLSRLAEALAVASTAGSVIETVAVEGPEVLDAETVTLAVVSEPEPDMPSLPEGARTLAIDVPSLDDERSLGTLHVGWRGAFRDDEPFRSRLSTLVELVSQTLERVRLAEAEHRLVEDLQARTIRPIPIVAGLEIVGRYEPAAAEVGMGGDWFEAIELSPTRLGFIVGDVVGHGVASAAEMSQLSAVLSTVLALGTPLESYFRRVHDVAGVGSAPHFVATASVTVLDPTTGRLRHVSAGHPPPIVLRGDGSTYVLEGGRAPVIGMPPGEVVPAEHRLVPGDSLFLYTDGLIERRGEDLETGLARLRSELSALTAATVEDRAAELVARCTLDGRNEDDIALVVVRIPTGS